MNPNTASLNSAPDPHNIASPQRQPRADVADLLAVHPELLSRPGLHDADPQAPPCRPVYFESAAVVLSTVFKASAFMAL